MEKNVVGTIVHFTENALKTAGFYTKHCKRDIITKEDIKRVFYVGSVLILQSRKSEKY